MWYIKANINFFHILSDPNQQSKMRGLQKCSGWQKKLLWETQTV